MKRNKIICPDCNIEISLSNFTKHKNSKQCLKNQNIDKIKVLEEWKQFDNNYMCPICNECFSKKGIGNHIWSKHTDIGIEFRKKNSESIFNMTGQTPWNFNLTKETDDRVLNASLTLSKKYKDKILIPPNLNKKHSDKTKKLMSEKALLSTHRRLVRSIQLYIKKDGTEVLLDSSWEVLLAELLDKKNYKWERPLIPLKWINLKGEIRNYFPDFYLNDFNIFLDPKNPFASKVQSEKINYIKENIKNVFFLNSIIEIENFEKIVFS